MSLNLQNVKKEISRPEIANQLHEGLATRYKNQEYCDVTLISGIDRTK